MKITKQGRLPQDVVYYGQCYHCATEFEFSPNDVSVREVELHGRISGTERYLCCPLSGCNTEIKLDLNYRPILF